MNKGSSAENNKKRGRFEMGEMNFNKAAIIAVMAALVSIAGWLAVPVALLVVCMVIDYGVGVYAATCRGEQIESKISIKGIMKKVHMLVLVVIGVVIDLLIVFLVGYLGIQIPSVFAIACVICVWLVVNEIISILENIEVIGLKIPFLMPFVKRIQKKVGDKINTTLDGKEDEEETKE